MLVVVTGLFGRFVVVVLIILVNVEVRWELVRLFCWRALRNSLRDFSSFSSSVSIFSFGRVSLGGGVGVDKEVREGLTPQERGTHSYTHAYIHIY